METLGSEMEPEVDLSDTQLDFGLDAEYPSITITTGTPASPSAFPSAANNPGRNVGAAASTYPNRPYYPKKPHRKSRAGCKQCKKRKVKCDESKPMCRSCSLRGEPCVYPTTGSKPSAASDAPQSTGSTPPACAEWELNKRTVPVLAEPMYMGRQGDAFDMKMLWFYNTYAFQAFSIKSNRSQVVNFTLRVKVMEHAFQSPFLMDTIMALSSLHLASLGQTVPAQKLITYQSRAFEGYRSAIERADPKDFPALLATSLFMVAVSSQNFRGPERKRLFITEWIAIWRGIGLIVELISPQAVKDSGLAVLFYRPPVDVEKATQGIPSNLLFMVSSMQPDDPDYPYQAEYYHFLKTLGSLYNEISEHGFGPILDLRVTTFFTFVPRALIPLARQNRPRMLIIIAHWLCFVRLRRTVDAMTAWWMTGFMPTMDEIFEEIGEEWSHLLRIPKAIMETDEQVKMVRLLLDNHEWEPSDRDLYVKHRDPRIKNGLKMINNFYDEIDLSESWLKLAKTNMYTRPQSPGEISEVDLSSQNFLLGSSLVYRRGPLHSPQSTETGSSPEQISPGSSESP
ncbi:hypothetical protein F5Y16DRAFT_164170 [Xylariaceae sp. FL0255]|nr:hypothetical protein F5Y16DRAFT_164170 [Xylariaceae sp. FL0255]